VLRKLPMKQKIQCIEKGCKNECGWGVVYKGQTFYHCEEHTTPKEMNLHGSYFILGEPDGIDMLYDM